MFTLMILSASLLSVSLAGLLGAGRGEGSCAAPPFRAPTEELKWSEGCPEWAACCTEYGYCQPKASWEAQLFRDCNGESNGMELPAETVQGEGEVGGEFVFPGESQELGAGDQLSQQQLAAESAPPLSVIPLNTDLHVSGLYLPPREA